MRRLLPAVTFALLMVAGSITPGAAANSATGWATYYDTGPGPRDAAAGPALKRMLGPNWRGDRVRVTNIATGAWVEVWVTDSCACGDRHGDPTVIDLHPTTFSKLAPTSAGIVKVRVTRASGALIPLPPTDTEEVP